MGATKFGISSSTQVPTSLVIPNRKIFVISKRRRCVVPKRTAQRGQMSRAALVTMFLIGIWISAFAGDSAETKESMMFSCLGRPFVGVAAMTPQRDGFPAVRLMLTDPLGRTAGEGSRGRRIPESSYGNIVEIPQHPDRSKARAVEVCNAEQGVYEIRVEELATDPYLLLASGDGAADKSDSAILNHIGRKGRIRQYRFKFTIKDRRLSLNWLDAQGREQLLIETPEW